MRFYPTGLGTDVGTRSMGVREGRGQNLEVIEEYKHGWGY